MANFRFVLLFEKELENTDTDNRQCRLNIPRTGAGNIFNYLTQNEQFQFMDEVRTSWYMPGIMEYVTIFGSNNLVKVEGLVFFRMNGSGL